MVAWEKLVRDYRSQDSQHEEDDPPILSRMAPVPLFDVDEARQPIFLKRLEDGGGLYRSAHDEFENNDEKRWLEELTYVKEDLTEFVNKQPPELVSDERNELTEAETAILRAYTGEWFRPISFYLRRGIVSAHPFPTGSALDVCCPCLSGTNQKCIAAPTWTIMRTMARATVATDHSDAFARTMARISVCIAADQRVITSARSSTAGLRAPHYYIAASLSWQLSNGRSSSISPPARKQQGEPKARRKRIQNAAIMSFLGWRRCAGR